MTAVISETSLFVVASNCCIVVQGWKLTMIFFLLWSVFYTIIYDSYSLHVCVLLGRSDWHEYRTKFGLTRGGHRAFYKPTNLVLRTLTQNMQTAVWTSTRGLIADPGILPVRRRGCIALDPSGCNDNEGYNMTGCMWIMPFYSWSHLKSGRGKTQWYKGGSTSLLRGLQYTLP